MEATIEVQAPPAGLLVYRSAAHGASFTAAQPAELREREHAIVKVTASWCGPCRNIQPHFEAHLDANPAVVGYVLDVDNATQAGGDAAKLCELLGADALPTFVLFAQGQEVRRFAGADQQKLEQLFAALKAAPDEPAPLPTAAAVSSPSPPTNPVGACPST